MLDFTKTIFENRKAKKIPLLAAHRGVCGANVPCNTMTAFKIAVEQGADIVELDVSKSKDGKFFVFHPQTEPVFLKSKKLISDMTAEEVEGLRLYNQDGIITSYKVPTLGEAFAYLKDKIYINVDKFWMDIPGIAEEIRKAGVEKQVIVKTFADEKSLAQVIEYAPDFMFMPLVKSRDEVSNWLISKGVNLIGTEILFDKETDDVIGDSYIEMMHNKGLLIWANAIVYDETAVISAYHTDDISLSDSPDKGWGWLADKNIDIIQTDWVLTAKQYFENRYRLCGFK